MKHLLILTALLFALQAHAEVFMHWVSVGDPGNAADDTGYGSVAYTYVISKHEVTNAQYTKFLNAVAATDTNDLYNPNMALTSLLGGITRDCSSGPCTYSTITGRENLPVNHVNFYDALRFANWLHNGQPTGAQDSTTTEDGAYTMITESYPDGPFITRNLGAKFRLPSEDEWYKAAYYDSGSASYFEYPAGSDTPTFCAWCSSTANNANCSGVYSDFEPVGCYTGSASPSGTFDQGGNVWEWNEAISGSNRGRRGGSRNTVQGTLAASSRNSYDPTAHDYVLGFRVARPDPADLVPSVSPVGMALLGGLIFGIGFVGLVIAARRRMS